MDTALLYGLCTMGFGFLALAVRYAFKSKCSDVQICCGLISIKRDVQLEQKDEEKDIETLEKK